MKKAIFTVLLPSGRYRINSGQTAPSGMTVSAAFDPLRTGWRERERLRA
jgi:hypothetical protein